MVRKQSPPPYSKSSDCLILPGRENPPKYRVVQKQNKNPWIQRMRLEIQGEGMAPQVGLEPTTLRLTAECSAIELLRNMAARADALFLFAFHHSIYPRQVKT